MGNCPKCNKAVMDVEIEAITASNFRGREFHGVAYVCRSCRAILSVGIDPVAVANDAVDRAVARIAKLLGRD